MNKLDSIIFDLDGTLWNTIDSCVKVLSEVKTRHPEVIREINREEVENNMGKSLEKIALDYYGYLDREKAILIATESFEENVRNVMKNGGTLYPNLEDTIKKLAKEYKLCIVSNCINGYIEAFLKSSNLSEYFTDFECNGKTKLSKGENIQLIIDRNNLKNAVYVGDTISDKQAADFAKIPFVYASYGFGNVDTYNIRIDAIDELPYKL